MLDDFQTLLRLGGTGTWGNAATRFLLEHTSATIRIFSRDELKQSEMAASFSRDRLRFLLGDIRDKDRLKIAMDGVDLVFHAAALKQVPSGEYNITEMIRTNVYGTENVVMAARETGVKRVVFLGTDKAVQPLNSYGISKSLAEKLVIQANGYAPHGTEYVCVRYGNVWQSRGSVGMIWQEALRQGNPLPVTDMSMTRFFITVDDAVKTAVFAAEYAPRGGIIVPHLPCYSMKDLCQAVMEESGYASCTVEYIGVRPGEKYHESLLGPEECSPERLALFLPATNDGGGAYYCVIPGNASWGISPLSAWKHPYGMWGTHSVASYQSDIWAYRLSVDDLRHRLREEACR